MQSHNKVEQHEKENLLKMEPSSELLFTGPFDCLSVSYLQLTNLTNKSVCYKVLNTAPKSYMVHRTFGLIGPKLSVTVEIRLKPFEYEAERKPKHKFMIKSIIQPGGDYDIQDLFKHATADQVMEAILLCDFEMPDDNKNASGVAKVEVQADDAKNVASEAVVAKVSDEQTANSSQESLPKEIHEVEDISMKQLMEQPVTEPDKAVNKLYASLAPKFSIVLAVFALLVGMFLGKYLL